MTKLDLILCVLPAALLVAIMPLWAGIFWVQAGGHEVILWEKSRIIAIAELVLSIAIMIAGVWLVIRMARRYREQHP